MSQYNIKTTMTGGVGIQTINTIGADGGGNFSLTSSGGTVTITPLANGDNLEVAGGPFLPLAGGTMTGTITSPAEYLYTQTSFATTMSQTGILATIVGMSSAQSTAYVVPASGNSFTILSYQGTTTVPTNVSQTIAGGTACTVYYYSNGAPVDATGTGTQARTALFSNSRYLSLGAGAQSYLGINSNSSAMSFAVGGANSAPSNTPNQSASQSGTTATGVGTAWDSTYVGHMIRYATGQVAWITAVGSTTSATVTPSQTVAATDFDIPGKTTTNESTAMDGRGNFGTQNLYVNGSQLVLGGNLTTSGAFTTTFTMTGATAVTFPTTGTLATTSQLPTLPLSLANGGTNASLTASNGGIFYSTATAGAILAGTATAGQMLRSGATAAPTWSTATFPATATGTGTILRADGTNWSATTATYPNTTTANQLLYSSATNVVGGLTSAANGTLVTDGSSVPSISSTLPSAVQNNITSVNSAANTLSIGGAVKTFVTGAVNVAASGNVTAWTPGISFGGGVVGITYSFQTGFYSTTTMPNGQIKTDFWGSIGLSNKGSSTGSAMITGFPTTTSTNATTYIFSCATENTSTSAGAQVFADMTSAATTASLRYYLNASANTTITNSNLNNNSVIKFSGSYWNN